MLAERWCGAETLRYARALVIGLVFVFMSREPLGKDTTIGDTRLTNIKTYRSANSDDENREATSEFNVGDPIQVGFSYDGDNENDLVRFSVVNRDSGEQTFETNLFRLAPSETELYVNINNTSLPAGKYRVELQTAEGSVSEAVDYEIVE